MRWTPSSDDSSVATMAAEKAILCVLFEEFSEPDEICINAWLILQNTLDVTVTALAVQNKMEQSVITIADENVQYKHCLCIAGYDTINVHLTSLIWTVKWRPSFMCFYPTLYKTWAQLAI